ncbi:MAG: hypothetical protein ABIA75_09385 [Candidatus Neomarinimicrobiota bacterium]
MSGENTKVYMKQGGDELVVANGGKITVESGGEIEVQDGGQIDDGVKVYRALLTQTGTDAPVATVLENSLGGVLVWTRSSTGVYTGTLAGVFLSGKVFGVSSAFWDNQLEVVVPITCYRNSDDTVLLSVSSDESLDNYPLTILVYP